MRFERTGAKTRAAVRFDHWGAANCGLQLGEIERAFYAACPPRRAALIGALIVFISVSMYSRLPACLVTRHDLSHKHLWP